MISLQHMFSVGDRPLRDRTWAVWYAVNMSYLILAHLELQFKQYTRWCPPSSKWVPCITYKAQWNWTYESTLDSWINLAKFMGHHPVDIVAMVEKQPEDLEDFDSVFSLERYSSVWIGNQHLMNSSTMQPEHGIGILQLKQQKNSGMILTWELNMRVHIPPVPSGKLT